jgi:hypothetical protein
MLVLRWLHLSQCMEDSVGHHYFLYVHNVGDTLLQLAWTDLHGERTKNLITIIAGPDKDVAHHGILHP